MIGPAPWRLPVDKLRLIRSGVARIAALISRFRGLDDPAETRVWTLHNELEQYDVGIAGDAVAPTAARVAVAQRVCSQMPQLAKALAEWLASHDDGHRPNGKALRWRIDHLSFGQNGGDPIERFLVELHAETDVAADHFDTSRLIACWMRADDVPDICVLGLSDDVWP